MSRPEFVVRALGGLYVVELRKKINSIKYARHFDISIPVLNPKSLILFYVLKTGTLGGMQPIHNDAYRSVVNVYRCNKHM